MAHTGKCGKPVFQAKSICGVCSFLQSLAEENTQGHFAGWLLLAGCWLDRLATGAPECIWPVQSNPKYSSGSAKKRATDLVQRTSHLFGIVANEGATRFAQRENHPLAFPKILSMRIPIAKKFILQKTSFSSYTQ